MNKCFRMCCDEISVCFRNQAEMAHTCRGTINLANAFISTEDSCTFIISNGGTQVFYLKATSEVERQKWVTALELAKAEAIRMLEAGLLNIHPLANVWLVLGQSLSVDHLWVVFYFYLKNYIYICRYIHWVVK